MPIISKTDFRSHTASLFKQHGVLEVTYLFTLQVSDLMYKHKQNKLPIIFKSYFFSKRLSTSHNTRNSSQYHVWFCRTSRRNRSLKLSGPRVWNSLPSYITTADNVGIYKKTEIMLISQY